jgi:hypothetical protein
MYIKEGYEGIFWEFHQSRMTAKHTCEVHHSFPPKTLFDSSCGWHPRLVHVICSSPAPSLEIPTPGSL